MFNTVTKQKMLKIKRIIVEGIVLGWTEQVNQLKSLFKGKCANK